MPSLSECRDATRDALASHYGSIFREDKPTELLAAILSVFLERSMDRDKAAKLVEALANAGFLDPEEMKKADPLEITETATSAGVAMSRKTVGPIKKLADWASKRDHIEEVVTETLRNELLAINGIGRATADAILLKALDRPVFPIDRASYRIFVRHGWLDPSADEEEARDVLERLDPDDVRGLALWSDWLDHVGAEFCRPSVPKCEHCPLRQFLPENGPIDPTGG